jgi:hypothetical protein
LQLVKFQLHVRDVSISRRCFALFHRCCFRNNQALPDDALAFGAFFVI